MMPNVQLPRQGSLIYEPVIAFAKKWEQNRALRRFNWALKHSPNRPFQNYMPSKRGERKQAPKGARARGVVMVSQRDQPPPIQGTPSLHHKFRFVATAAATNVVTFAGLAAIGPGVVDAVNSTVVPVCSSYKLHSVEVWSPAAAGGEVAANVVFSNSAQGYTPDAEILRNVLGSATPGYLIARPPKNSLDRFWINPGNMPNTTYFTVATPASAIIDVSITMRTSNELGVTARPIAAGALGAVVYLALDNASAAGTHNLVPYGLPTVS